MTPAHNQLICVPSSNAENSYLVTHYSTCTDRNNNIKNSSGLINKKKEKIINTQPNSDTWSKSVSQCACYLSHWRSEWNIHL